MPTDDRIRTAKAARYRRDKDRPIITTQSGPEDGSDCGTSSSRSPQRPSLRSYDTIYPDTGIRDGIATYLSCLNRGYSNDIAQRVVDWEREHQAAVDKYATRDARPCETSSLSMWARAARLPGHTLDPPSPLSSSPSPPLRFGLLPRLYEDERQNLRPPIQKLKKLNLRSKAGSPSTYPTSRTANDHTVQKDRKEETRQHPPVSYLTEEVIRDGIARNLAQTDYLRSQREQREADERKERERKEMEKEKAKREQTSTVEKRLKLDDVPDWLKTLAKSYREKFSRSDKLFRKDFDFGPKTQCNKDDDYRRPTSPCSSGSSLPELCPEVRSRSLKRQRHDSSNAKVGRESPHDRLHVTSSPTSIQRAQPNASASMLFMRGFGMPDVHPGQRVDFTAFASPRFEADRNDGEIVRFQTSDYDRDDVADYLRAKTHDPVDYVHGHWTPITPQVGARDCCCETDLRRHPEMGFSLQGKLRDNAEEAQAAVDEAVRMKTCELQRKPRTTRDHPPVLFEPVSRARTAEPLVSKWSPLMTPIAKTDPTQSSALQDEHFKRRRSYVARRRSTHAFLRNICESQKRRQLVLDMEYMGQPRADTPDPRCPEEKDNWLGDEPL